MSSKEELVWCLSRKSKSYVGVKKGKHRTFSGELEQEGICVLFVSLVKEVAASKKGVSTLSRFVHVNLTIKAHSMDIEDVTHHEKGTISLVMTECQRFWFEVPSGGGIFFLEFTTPAVIRPVYVTARIQQKAQLHPHITGPTVERVTTELLEISSETEAKLANWVEEQAKNQEAIKELTKIIEEKQVQLDELKKQEKSVLGVIKVSVKSPRTPEQQEFKNQMQEQETLLRALQKNLRRLELEEIDLGCKQLQVKIQIQKKEIAELDEILTACPNAESSCSLFNEREEKQMLLDSLISNLELLRGTQGGSSAEVSDSAEMHHEQIFDIKALPPVQRERVQNQIDKWPSLKEFPDILTYPQHVAVDELTRDSEFKQKAWNKGLIKPFLLLVSLHPEKRICWAKSLNINLLSMKNYGDPHAEAYKVLTMDRKGLQARANHAFADTLNPLGQNCNWYQILYRVCRKTLQCSSKVDNMKCAYSETRKNFDESIGYCTKKEDQEICFLEELFLKGIMQVMMFLLEESDQATLITINKAMDNVPHTDARRYINNLRACGFNDDQVINFFVSSIIHGGENFFTNCLLNWAKSKHEGEAVGRLKIALPIVGMAFSVMLAVPIFLVLGLLSPLILLPTSMLAVNTAMYVWRETPGKLLNPLLVILMQEVYLALQGISVQDFYPTNISREAEKATQIRNSVADAKKRTTENFVGKLKNLNKEVLKGSFPSNQPHTNLAMESNSAPVLALEAESKSEPIENPQEFTERVASAPHSIEGTP
eukprot:CAMPEP_0206210250 /NCGR_PEP_ID=MMETSP0166-20121206/17429_1 /ASSEMBLY_ACC=CAM_ASM_000260 /TAXON_ID=95228 /ORGANISM="Vannella robusta, Strain DIVA3 518/3/11/1/6" /LENGTH=767 /DNA_ID=CAMNT_0053631875 /DNA_START=1118 /DNA_END=3418 /DNA_ORIENTATION=-